MAVFGRFGNIFRMAVSNFAKAGKSFSQTLAETTLITGIKHPIKTYRAYQESRTFNRMKPFYQKVGQRFVPTLASIIPTQVRLRDRYQYIFEVEMFSTGIAGKQTQTFSLLASEKWTKGTVESKMGEIIRQQEDKQKYGEIIGLTVNLVGVRQSRFIK